MVLLWARKEPTLFVASEMILADNFATIVTAVREGRAVWGQPPQGLAHQHAH
jgi:hypothetical protein